LVGTWKAVATHIVWRGLARLVKPYSQYTKQELSERSKKFFNKNPLEKGVAHTGKHLDRMAD